MVLALLAGVPRGLRVRSDNILLGDNGPMADAETAARFLAQTPKPAICWLRMRDNALLLQTAPPERLPQNAEKDYQHLASEIVLPDRLKAPTAAHARVRCVGSQSTIDVPASVIESWNLNYAAPGQFSVSIVDTRDDYVRQVARTGMRGNHKTLERAVADDIDAIIFFAAPGGVSSDIPVSRPAGAEARRESDDATITIAAELRSFEPLPLVGIPPWLEWDLQEANRRLRQYWAGSVMPREVQAFTRRFS
jgi:hypothetical protein